MFRIDVFGSQRGGLSATVLFTVRPSVYWVVGEESRMG